MGLSKCVAIVLFFAVPFLFWWILTAITERGRQKTFSAV